MLDHVRGAKARLRLGAIFLAILLFAAIEVRVFVFPPTDPLTAADAVVMFNGPGERTELAWELADDHGLARTVVVSVPNTDSCTYRRPWLEEYCLTPRSAHD